MKSTPNAILALQPMHSLTIINRIDHQRGREKGIIAIVFSTCAVVYMARMFVKVVMLSQDPCI